MDNEKIITWNIKSPDGLQSITIRHDDKLKAQDYANWAMGALPNKHTFPNDSGDKVHTAATESNPVCPEHHKQMTKGEWGYYCKTKVGTENGKALWCKYKPPEEKV